jgi:uncharacterized iron-regulated membrane protein
LTDAEEVRGWRRWLDHPQRVWLRRAVFQVHLWLALALGAYVVMISLTGSAVVFRREFNLWLVPRFVPAAVGTPLTADELRRAVERAYPDQKVVAVHEPRRRNRPVSVELERGGKVAERLFDPYAAVDMGSSFPPFLRAVEWLVELHDNLLGGEQGRVVNGVAALLVTVVVLSGAVIWWPGRRRWRLSLVVGRPGKNRRFAWQLHSALGFWTLALLLMWTSTAVYFAFPDPFEDAMDYFDTDKTDQTRPGEALLLLLVKLHFGRFGGVGVGVLWVILGLVPAILFVTGFILWWTRVLRPKWRASRTARREQGPRGAKEVFRGRDADRAT